MERADNPDFANPTEVCRKYFTEGATSYTYTDQVNDLNLNGTYYYRIRRTAVDKWGWASALTKTAEVDLVMNHIHVTNASATMDESGSKAVITWDWNGNVWLNNSKVTIVRTNESRSTTATFTPSAQEFADRKFVDLLPTTCDVYSYKMYVTPGSSYYRTQDELTVAEPNGRLFVAVMGDFESIEASKGYYGDCIMLDWTTDDKPIESFSITARMHGSDTPYKQIGQLTASTGLTNYTYTYDKCVAGVLYDFQVLAISHCGNDAVTMKSDEIIGFSRPTGTVNGRITFGSGQNVKDVTVKAVPEENSFTKNKAYSFPGTTGTYLEIEDETLLGKKSENITVQAWVNTQSSDARIVLKSGWFNLQVRFGQPALNCCGRVISAPNSIVGKGFVNITGVARTDSILLYVNGEKVAGGPCVNALNGPANSKVQIGENFKGEIDEVRLWSRALTAQEIADNYGKCLVGDEDGL
ncbi:MAG: LamG domain-containing protein, partial [Muribaculaceae bacterium]|nr:LamG domain-containing protein [Muribaculaceae bacterium]